jgi:hypothetical protein
MGDLILNWFQPHPVVLTDCVYLANEYYNMWFVTTEIAVFWFSVVAFIIGCIYGYLYCRKKYGSE